MLYKTSFTGTPSKVNMQRHHFGAEELMLGLWTDQLLGQLPLTPMFIHPEPKGSPCVTGPDPCSTRRGMDSQLL